jgi:hypothetical protein
MVLSQPDKRYYRLMRLTHGKREKSFLVYSCTRVLLVLRATADIDSHV